MKSSSIYKLLNPSTGEIVKFSKDTINWKYLFLIYHPFHKDETRPFCMAKCSRILLESKESANWNCKKEPCIIGRSFSGALYNENYPWIINVFKSIFSLAVFLELWCIPGTFYFEVKFKKCVFKSYLEEGWVFATNKDKERALSKGFLKDIYDDYVKEHMSNLFKK